MIDQSQCWSCPTSAATWNTARWHAIKLRHHPKLPLHVGDLGPISNVVLWAHMTQYSKWHLDQFSHFCRAQVCDQHSPMDHIYAKNIKPLTPIMFINYPLSASSIYYDPLLTNKDISLIVRERVYSSCVQSRMLHGSET